MAARPVYEADREVLAECTRRGVLGITARKLERWRRYLPDRVVEHRCNLRGSRTTNPSGYVDQVVVLDALLKAGMPLRHAPIHLFARGFSMKIDDLREAYTDLYAHLRDGLTKNLTQRDDDELADHADRLATFHAAGIRTSAAGRRWAKRARQQTARGGAFQGDTPSALFTSALSTMFTWMIAGEQPSTQGITEALSIAGLNDGQDPEAAGVGLAAMNLDAVLFAIDQATEPDWRTARDNIDLLARYSELRYRADNLGLPDDARLHGLADLGLDSPDLRAILIPMGLALGDTWQQRVVEEIEQLSVVARVLAAMPDNLRLQFREYASRREEAPTEVFVELQAFFVTLALTHPDDAALFGIELPLTPADGA